MKPIKEMIAGDPIEGIDLLVEKKNAGTAKNGKPYLRVTLRDQTGSLNANVWDATASSEVLFTEGSVVQIWGAVENYNGTLQIRIGQAEPSQKDAMDLSKRTPFDVEEMFGKIVEIIGSMKEPLTKYVAEELLLKQSVMVEAFKKAPAAKGMHNAWFGGLLEHVHSLCLIAEPVIQHYQTRYCSKISRDKVMFGLMLHDAGKVIEYDYSRPSFNYTQIGQLTNHMVLGPAWVFEAANRFPERASLSNFKLERSLLMHVLAAHHGTAEWGSPVKPATLEAILVHHLDNLDAKVLHAMDFVTGKQGPIPGFSERSYFEQVHFYQYD